MNFHLHACHTFELYIFFHGNTISSYFVGFKVRCTMLRSVCFALQVVHDVDLQKLPVRFALDRAGLVGADGPTHSGSFDVTYMACLPNMVVMAPSDEAELFHMVATAAAINDRPSCFRYPRGNGIGVQLPPGNKGVPLEVKASFIFFRFFIQQGKNI